MPPRGTEHFSGSRAPKIIPGSGSLLAPTVSQKSISVSHPPETSIQWQSYMSKLYLLTYDH